ncbi:D-2-hydroxyacid dehydrogenase [Vallitalea okinawensis]|uniref:D-2-hydroxyacid dehydrogenase n=1 Tax=Vallitalea okinawensis TaxID=2078660 RepID=UPI000CFB11AE|nr:D-2-hydroxyacid dehydrogenase [Vallitalea okinawensis]
MFRILVCDGMDKSAMVTLMDAGFEVIDEHYEVEELKVKVKEFDAMIVRSATKVRQPIIDAALETKRLKLIVRAGVGVDNIDVAYAMENGIEVRNTPNASSASVAELAIAHMFAVARHVHSANVTMRNDEWNKKQYKGIELNGKTLGLIGFGRIAREVAKRASALGMKVIYTDYLGEMEGYDDFAFKSFDDLLVEADFISLHIPFNAEKGAVLGKEEFAKMKDGVILINTARGGVVCEKALVEALDSGKVAAAGVDVFEEEPTKNEALYKHPKVSVTPHIGASTKEAQARIGIEIVDTITDFFD